MTFDNLQLAQPIMEALKRARYTEATPIQSQAIPVLLDGNDLIGIAQTGTGKTAAFLLPLIHKLSKHRRRPNRNFPRALILAPTRELAAQIGESCEVYGKFTDLSYTVIFGGVKQGNQVKALNKGVDILVATPGRLLDLMDQGYIKLDEVATFVLDEADRMLDMGFVNDIRQLKPFLQKDCQTIMFSATMSKEVNSLAQDFLSHPVSVQVTPEGTAVERIHQELFFVDRPKKMDLLLYLLNQDLDHVLIFTRTKHGADRVARALKKNRIPADSIHGDKTQAMRTRALDKFHKGKVMLVATDIAARGIDVDGISHIINYDLPNDPENYVHRIGRTARAGAKGTAYSFCDETENEYLQAIEKLTKCKLDHVDHPYHSDKAMKSKQPAKRGGRGRPSGRSGRGTGSRSPGPKGRANKDRRNRNKKSNADSRRSENDRPKRDRKGGGRDSSRKSSRGSSRAGGRSRSDRSESSSRSDRRGGARSRSSGSRSSGSRSSGRSGNRSGGAKKKSFGSRRGKGFGNRSRPRR